MTVNNIRIFREILAYMGLVPCQHAETLGCKWGGMPDHMGDGYAGDWKRRKLPRGDVPRCMTLVCGLSHLALCCRQGLKED